MQFKTTAVALAFAALGSAQNMTRGSMSVCDYYTTALLKQNNATNQLTLLTLLVNTAVIGNYTKPQIPGITWPDVKVTGILNNGTINGTTIHLLPYFDGGLASSNRGDKAVAVNFLDDGGAVPLMMNKPANGTDSNQYRLLTHLYQFFGTLLGCSQQGMTGFDAYMGAPSMGSVHKFMNLNNAQNTYFIQQVGLSAASFGVTMDDVQGVGKNLSMAFGMRCAPNITLTPALGPQQQAICQAEDCPIAASATCAAYPTFVPAVANMSLAEGLGNSSASVTATAPNGGKPTAMGTGMASGSASGSAGAARTSTASAGGAAHVVGGGMAAGLGLFAFLL